MNGSQKQEKTHYIYGREYLLKDSLRPFDKETELRSLVQGTLSVFCVQSILKKVYIVNSFVTKEKYLLNWYCKFTA